jgi:hypothetical protein
VDVVLLGPSNVGKSTYLSSMYHAMQGSRRGFTLSATQERDHAHLMGQAEQILAGRYPPGTNHRITYETVLRHQGQEVMTISWRDHRGGALQERSSSAEAADLLKALASAHGLLVFADAPGLLGSQGRSNHQARELTVQLMRALPQLHSRILPLTLVISKMDLVPAEQDTRARVLAPLESLLGSLSQAPNIHLKVAWVACNPRPAGVLGPALWTLCFGLIQRGHQLSDRVAHHLHATKAAVEVERDTQRSRRLSAAPPKGPTPWTIAWEHQNQALLEWSRMIPLLGHAMHLLEN